MARIDPNPRARIVDQPQPGHFAMRLVKHGPRVPAKIEIVDGKWTATVNGEVQAPSHEDPADAAGVLNIWHFATAIPEHEYIYMNELREWATLEAPDHPAANPRKPIDFALMQPLPVRAETRN